MEVIGAWYNKGNKTWMRFCKPEHYFVRFHAFGISKSILKQLIQYYDGDTDQTLLFIYKGKTGVKKYQAKLEQFLLSEKEWNNIGDVQKMVSLKDMMLLDDQRIIVEEEEVND
jgi:hypothetical protein